MYENQIWQKKCGLPIYIFEFLFYCHGGKGKPSSRSAVKTEETDFLSFDKNINNFVDKKRYVVQKIIIHLINFSLTYILILICVNKFLNYKLKNQITINTYSIIDAPSFSKTC